MNILITGGNGGIGLALSRLCLKIFPDALIYATFHAEQPEFSHQRLQWLKLDITDEKAIESLAEKFNHLNMVINAAGILHNTFMPEKTIQAFNTDFFKQNMAINTIPGILMAKYFQAPLKNAKGNTYFVVLSARVGSLSDNQLGGWLSYRTSKAALNMAMKTISIEWKRTVPDCCIMLFHPGTTDTTLSKPFQRNVPADKLHTPEKTAEYLIDLIQKLGPDDSGKFFSYNGNVLPW